MFQRFAWALAAAACFWIQPAFAEPDADPDAPTLRQGFDALAAKDFDGAVVKAQEIITRFETGRRPDAVYLCASGGPDTLTQLFGAALSKDKGNGGEPATTVAVSSNICDAYFLKGFALVDLGRRADALPNLETAIAMDPDNSHYLNELGEWYKTGRQWEKSLEVFTRASETRDLSLDYLDNKAEAKRIRGDRLCRSYRGISFSQSELRRWDDARAALQKCLTIHPNDPGSLNELAYIAEQSGKDR
jgi:tetratricopeptide (TPR) repeat protein